MASGPEEQGQRRVSRILIYGVTGSGKTTLARRMSGLTGLPWHSVDDLTWEPNWVVVPIDGQRRRIEEICAGEEWILDYAYAYGSGERSPWTGPSSSSPWTIPDGCRCPG